MKRRTTIKVESPTEAKLQSIATADTHPPKQYEEIVAFAAKTKNGVLRLVHHKSTVWLPVPLILLLIVAVQTIISIPSKSAYSPPAFRSDVTANYEVSNQSFSKIRETDKKFRAVLDMEVPFIHIVNSRFQQHDKNLSALGAARYELFETFCLPSMVHQTIQPNATEQEISGQPQPYRYIWIIKVDPKLDPELRNRMVEQLQPYPNFYLVGSNNNFGLSFGGGSWRNGKAGNDVLYGNLSAEITTTGSTMIYTGDVSILQAAHDRREEKIILETRLDADDGLPVTYLESIQKSAAEDLISKSQMEEYKKENSTFLKQATSNKMKWMFWCMPHAYNWYPGVLVNGSKQSENDPGHVTMEGNSICLTTGLTSAISVGVDTFDVPRIAHHKVLARLKLDKKKPRHFCGIEKKATSCIHVLDKVYAMRARTPTSDGMSGVSFRKIGQDEIRSNLLWDKMFQVFGIDRERAAHANNYIEKNLLAILKDNLAGQCSHLKGRLCEKSKKNVQALIDAAAVKAVEVRQGKQE